MSKITNGTPEFIAEVLLDPESHGFPATFTPDIVALVRLALAYQNLRSAIQEIRESDCGGWLKDCTAKPYFSCHDGIEKRQELRRLLDKLYALTQQSK